MSQTVYNVDRTAALAGMLADSGDVDVVSYPAGEDIESGRVVVLGANGTVGVPSATTLTKVVGVAIYRPSVEQAIGGGSAGYKAGEMVSVLRKGRIWAQFTGGTQAALGAVNVHHSSTTATNRGKFTNSATSSTAGAEITAAPEGVITHKVGTSTLVQVSLNLPA